MSNREERAWAAGFFDGEGSTHVQLPYYLTVALGQSGDGGHDNLERFKRAVGVGVITGPYQGNLPGRQPRWYYAAKGQFDARQVLDALWPWLGDVKRRQAEVAVAAYEAAPVKRQKRRRAPKKQK